MSRNGGVCLVAHDWRITCALGFQPQHPNFGDSGNCVGNILAAVTLGGWSAITCQNQYKQPIATYDPMRHFRGSEILEKILVYWKVERKKNFFWTTLRLIIPPLGTCILQLDARQCATSGNWCSHAHACTFQPNQSAGKWRTTASSFRNCSCWRRPSRIKSLSSTRVFSYLLVRA